MWMCAFFRNRRYLQRDRDKGMLLRAGPGWNWFHLEKQSLFFLFVCLKQSLLSWKSRTDFRQRAWHLRGAHGCYSHEGWKVRGARQRDKEHKLLDSKRHEHTEGPVSILVWATRVLSEESKLIMKFLVVDHRRLPTQKKWEVMERSQLGKSVRWYFGDVSPTAGWKLH